MFFEVINIRQSSTNNPALALIDFQQKNTERVTNILIKNIVSWEWDQTSLKNPFACGQIVFNAFNYESNKYDSESTIWLQQKYKHPLVIESYGLFLRSQNSQNIERVQGKDLKQLSLF